MKKLCTSTLVLIGVLLLGCAREVTVPSWPELSALDVAVEAFDSARAGGAEDHAVATALAKVIAAMESLVESPIPASLPNRRNLEQGVGELKTLVELLRAGTDTQNPPPYDALHPLVEELLHEAGIPHVH